MCERLFIHTLMADSSPPALSQLSFVVVRRLFCVLLMLCFGSFSAEVAIADVHDGDAPGLAAAGDAAGGQVPPAPDAGDEGRNHDVVHVCHCVHAHGSLDPVDSALPVALPESSITMVFAVLGPASADLDPHLRPPIA